MTRMNVIRIKKNYDVREAKPYKPKLVYDLYWDDYEGQNCDFWRGCVFWNGKSWCYVIDPSIYDHQALYEGFSTRDVAVNEAIKMSLARLDGVMFMYDKNNPSKYIKLVK